MQPTLDPSWPVDLRELLTQCFALAPSARPDMLAFQEALRFPLVHRDRAELEARIDKALALEQQERDRLKKLGLYLDPRSGRLARYSMIGLLTMVWVGLPLLLAILGVERSPGRILAQNASVATVLLLVGARKA